MLKSSIKLAAALSITLLFPKCDTSKQYSEEESKKPSEEMEFKKLSFKTSVIQEKANPCINDECTMVTLTFPELDKKESGANSINETLVAHANQMIIDLIPPGVGTGKKIKQNMSAFVKSYEEFKEAFPEVNTPWTIDIDISLTYQNARFTSFRITNDNYTGGAHPNSSVEFLNFDNQGNIIKGLSFFVSSTSKLKSIAEKEFRKSKGLSEGESLSEAGFTFENDQFSLPETYGFSSEGMVFYYNSYEIVAYAEGPTELVIPFVLLKEIKNF